MSLALLYLALRGIKFTVIQSRLSQINVGWIGLAVIVTAVQIFIGALRWREISELCQAPLTDLQAFRYNMIGAFFNQTLPSSIGGDAVRLWRARQSHRCRPAISPADDEPAEPKLTERARVQSRPRRRRCSRKSAIIELERGPNLVP
jgi:Lysylphosphatidylglycerol synthase TM region